jgi:hypothetical protein
MSMSKRRTLGRLCRAEGQISPVSPCPIPTHPRTTSHVVLSPHSYQWIVTAHHPLSLLARGKSPCMAPTNDSPRATSGLHAQKVWPTCLRARVVVRRTCARMLAFRVWRLRRCTFLRRARGNPRRALLHVTLRARVARCAYVYDASLRKRRPRRGIRM